LRAAGAPRPVPVPEILAGKIPEILAGFPLMRSSRMAELDGSGEDDREVGSGLLGALGRKLLRLLPR